VFPYQFGFPGLSTKAIFPWSVRERSAFLALLRTGTGRVFALPMMTTLAVFVYRWQYISAKLAVGLVAVFLSANPIQALNVVTNDRLRTVLAVLETTGILATGSREDAYPIVEDAVHRLPIFVAFQRRFWPRVVDFLEFEVTVVAQDHRPL
jgi:hypothetical protein